jgi:hypothetical protein
MLKRTLSRAAAAPLSATRMMPSTKAALLFFIAISSNRASERLAQHRQYAMTCPGNLPKKGNTL